MTLTTLLRRNNFPAFFEDDFINSGSLNRIDTPFSPKANVVEHKDSYQIDIEAPGITKEDLEITFKNNTLKVTGEKKNNLNHEEAHHYSFESSYGRFERSWIVKDVNHNQVKAEFNHGILTIHLPKKEEVIAKEQEKKISIQ